MSRRYLLPCNCGLKIPISVSQAGDRVQCECGVELEAPTFRQIQDLEPAGEVVAEAPSWGFRQGVLAMGIILASLLAATAGYIALTQPAEPEAFDPIAWTDYVEANIDDLNTYSAWIVWRDIYSKQVSTELLPMEQAGETELRRMIDAHQFYRNRLLIAAGAILVATLVLTPLLPR